MNRGSKPCEVPSGPVAWEYLLRSFSACVVWPIIAIGGFSSALSATSWSEWFLTVCTCLAIVVAFVAFGIPQRWLIPWWLEVMFGGGILGMASSALWRQRVLGGSLSLVDAVPVLAAVGVAAAAWADRRLAVREELTLARWPLREGSWIVAQGEGAFLNHHWRVRAQRAALDLVGCGRTGRSSKRIVPKELEDFVAYGATVIAPCDGTVVSAERGLPDNRFPGVPPMGNHVTLASGSQRVVMAHLRQDSVKVQLGDLVRAGDAVGRVGNSGNSSEPHLHIHATRSAYPLRLRFADVPGGFRRGRWISGRRLSRRERLRPVGR